MSQQSTTEGADQVTFPPLDMTFIQQISMKAVQLNSILANLAFQMLQNNFSPNIKMMVESTNRLIQFISPNLNYLNNTDIFRDDFKKAIHTIDTAYNTYFKAIASITDIRDYKLINKIRINIDNFAQSIIIFSGVFEEIITEASNPENSSYLPILNMRLGLESALFNFAVTVEPSNNSPFIKSRFVEIYKCYHTINKINTPTAAIKSVCGTGKTLCLPIILLCRSLKERLNAPFLLITQPSPKHVESKENFFKKTIEKYVTIVTDPDSLEKMYNEYAKTRSIDRPVLAVLTPHNLLPLMFALRRNQHFYPNSRIIIDEIHQRTFHLDVLISKISLFDQSMKLFTLPLSVILMSASINQSIINPFNGRLKVTTLIKYPQFEIVEKPPIIETNVQRINNELMRDQTVMAIKEMAKLNTTVEEGHILCFLSGIGICTKLKNAVISQLKNSEETQNSRKIVMLQTSLRPNETTESYFRRLREEFMFNEGIREGKKYKNKFLYFVPIILSGLVEDAIYDLAQNEFPGDLCSINKLICSTPMIESSFTIDRLSVVVDSGLFKETEFDRGTCLTTLTEKQTSQESMDQRKGRLGRTMKGLYISIHAPNNMIPMIQVPPVQRLDLTTNILLMKDICINFESMTNLPTLPNRNNLEFAMNTLKYIGAIDSQTFKITPFGHELLNYPFISIFYAAAVINFRESFPADEKAFANFIAAYVATIITMDTLLVEEDMTEKMSRFFKDDSDITTLINPLNILLKAPITDNDQLRDSVESYGFSYAHFLVFKTHIQEIIDLVFPGKTIADVLNSIGGFIRKYGGITGLVDLLIPHIGKVFPKWMQIHKIKFKNVSGAGGFDSRPTIIFSGSANLIFYDQRQREAEVRISKRPGWNGIMIPTECYCFNITRNSNSKLNYGRLVHRVSNSFSSGAITSIECDKIALNPWFDVLLDTYFKNSKLNVSYFTNIIKPGNKRYPPITEKRMFHYSNAGERVFISFVPNDTFVKKNVVEGINNCLKLMPFTPRSVLVYRSDVQEVVEITSIGAQFYVPSIASQIQGEVLSRKKIDYCLQNLKELAQSNSSIRICALFINETCKLNEYDQKNLYIIDNYYHSGTLLKYIAQRRAKEMRYSSYNNQDYNNNNSIINNINNESYELRLYQFPTKFIHPALMYHQESIESIMKWFRQYHPNMLISRVIGHRILMRLSSIIELQNLLRNDRQKIKEEMNLKYVAIPVPSNVYSKIYLTIREHPTWNYNERFKVVIVLNEEQEEVANLVNKTKEEIEKNKPKDKEKCQYSDETLCCCYICDDPDNPVLTSYPITIYFKDGKTYTNKMCRDCLTENMKVATESFYHDGIIDQNALAKLAIKPSVIPSIDSKETENGLECWPQIPLGQMISALINNADDEELSNLISAWLQGVSEFTVRNLARDKFTFCPDHPLHLYSLQNQGNDIIKCKAEGCQNELCPYCNCWHLSSFVCQSKKDGNTFVWKTKCPKCKSPTYKDGGCNHITCICGCHWCYKCGEGFVTASQCYEHLSRVHGGCFDYEFDD